MLLLLQVLFVRGVCVSACKAIHVAMVQVWVRVGIFVCSSSWRPEVKCEHCSSRAVFFFRLFID